MLHTEMVPRKHTPPSPHRSVEAARDTCDELILYVPCHAIPCHDSLISILVFPLVGQRQHTENNPHSHKHPPYPKRQLSTPLNR